MSRVVNILFWFMLAAFVLEFSLNVKISNIPGFSLKNIAIYSLLMTMLIVNPIRNKPIINRNELIFPIILFVFYCAISLITTAMFHAVPGYSMLGELILFKGYMDPYILFIITCSIIHDEKSIYRLLIAMLIIMVVFVAITVLSSFNIVNITRAVVDDRWGRTTGAFAEANQFAAYLVTFLPLLGAFLFTSKSKSIKLILLGILFVSLYVLLLTGSRGGILSLAVAVGVYYVFYSKYPLPRTIINLFGIYFVALLMVVMVFFILPEQTANGLMLKLTGKFVDVAETDYTSGRLDIWAYAFQRFLDSPVFGTGWNTFVHLFGSNSHSDYILFLITTGVVGLYLFIQIYYRLFIAVNRYRKENTAYRHFFNAYISGLAAFMVALMFVNIYNPSYFVMLYSALIIKLGMIVSTRKEIVEEEPIVESNPRITMIKKPGSILLSKKRI